MMDSTPNNWHTWRELSAQPAIWRDWAAVLERDAADHRAWIDGLDIDEIWLSGAGTSAFIGDIVADAHPRFLGRTLRAVASTDMVADPARYLSGPARPLIINFGRSGNSAESLGVLAAIKTLAPATPVLNVTCNPDGALAMCDTGARLRVITLPSATHDAGFAMTSSFSTMLLTALALIDPAVAPARALPQLSAQAERLIPMAADIVAAMPVPDRVVFVGSGPLRFAAREAALKVMELTAGRVPALWDSTLGFRHGPKAFMTADTLTIVMRAQSAHPARYDADLIAELAAQYPGNAIRTSGPHGADFSFESELPDAWAAVLHVSVAQVMGVFLSNRLGLNVDDPFVGQGTLSRVVSGVQLYDVGTGAA